MIDPRHTYAVSARIRFNEKILFRNALVHPVLTRDNPDRAEVMMEIMAASAEATKLFGVTWVAEDVGGGGVIDNARSTIAFAADGTVSGSGGCNSFSGRARVDGDRIEFGPLAATQKACVPALADQEQKFFKALAGTRMFAIDERTNKLILRDAGGIELARFDRGAGRVR
jgi:putative lipoprotein